jgi:DNA-binding NtrC family response regulator
VSGKETILLVADRKQLRTLAESALTRYGYRVLTAANPEEALRHAEGHAGPIHLMLTDVVLPGITGPVLAGRIKPLRPAMEAIFMSRYSDRTILGHLAVPVSFLPKSYFPESLSTRVRGVLGLPRSLGTILVADDDAAIRTFLRNVLFVAGYEVLEGGSGKDVMRQVEAAEIDLVIMDLAMPEQDGIQTIQILHHTRPDLKIIAISGRFVGLLGAAELFGAKASLTKPVKPDDLLDVVARVMG